MKVQIEEQDKCQYPYQNQKALSKPGGLWFALKAASFTALVFILAVCLSLSFITNENGTVAFPQGTPVFLLKYFLKAKGISGDFYAYMGNRPVFVANSGHNVLKGGKGDDILLGGQGSDTYVWGPGEGSDTIIDERSGDDRNILQINGVAPEKVRAVRRGDNLLLLFQGSDEQITLLRWFSPDSPGTLNQYRLRLHAIEFEDGTVWTPDNPILTVLDKPDEKEACGE